MTNNYRFDSLELLLGQCATLAADGTRYDMMKVVDVVYGGDGGWKRSHQEVFRNADDSEKLEMCFNACYAAIKAMIDSDVENDGEYDEDAPVYEHNKDLLGRTYDDPDGDWLIVDSDGQNVTIKCTNDFEESWQSPKTVSVEEAWYFIKHDSNGTLKPQYQQTMTVREALEKYSNDYVRLDNAPCFSKRDYGYVLLEEMDESDLDCDAYVDDTKADDYDVYISF